MHSFCWMRTCIIIDSSLEVLNLFGRLFVLLLLLLLLLLFILLWFISLHFFSGLLYCTLNIFQHIYFVDDINNLSWTLFDEFNELFNNNQKSTLINMQSVLVWLQRESFFLYVFVCLLFFTFIWQNSSF